MSEITIGNIVSGKNYFYVNKSIKHPYVYTDGTIDMTPIQDLLLKSHREFKENIEKLCLILLKTHHHTLAKLPLYFLNICK